MRTMVNVKKSNRFQLLSIQQIFICDNLYYNIIYINACGFVYSHMAFFRTYLHNNDQQYIAHQVSTHNGTSISLNSMPQKHCYIFTTVYSTKCCYWLTKAMYLILQMLILKNTKYFKANSTNVFFFFVPKMHYYKYNFNC